MPMATATVTTATLARSEAPAHTMSLLDSEGVEHVLVQLVAAMSVDELHAMLVSEHLR